MMIFGELWDAPVCEDAKRAPTPIGDSCLYCTEPIQDGEQGFIMPAVSADGTVTPRPVHRECNFVQVVGNLAHVQGRCQYIGHCNQLREDEGRTVREDALAAWAWGTVRP